MTGRTSRGWTDKRAFAVFDVGYLDNPKIAHLFDASPIAVCMHFASVLYCAQHLTDGEVAPLAMQRKTGGTKDDTRLLVDAGLWHRPNHDCDQCPNVSKGKVYVHDYTKHNRTSERVKRSSDAGKRGAEARWNADAKRIAKRMHFASEPHSEPQCETDEIAMHRQTDRHTVKSSLSEPAARPEVEELCTLLADLVEGNGSKRPTITKAWRDAARLMLDRDERDPIKAAELIRWVQRDDFWKANVMSMPKFRKQYDALRLRAVEDWQKNGGKTSASPDGQIDVNAVLGKDVWSAPSAPPELWDDPEAERDWLRERREERKAARLEEAKQVLARRQA